jgi:hypothetical protein
MPATTTQRTEAAWHRYFTLLAESEEASARHSDLYAEALAASPEPRSEEREDTIETYRTFAQAARDNAAVYRRLAAGHESGCICGGLARLADAPCAHCESTHPTAGERALLGAMGHSVHAEVSDGR